MTRRMFFTTVVIALAGLFAFNAPLMAQDSIESVTKSMQARYRDLYKAKLQGKIGETIEGFVAAVQGGGDVQSLINAENADRRKLYQLLAKKEGVTVDEVAQTAAARNFRNAGPEEWLRGPNGKWVQKKDQ